MSVYTQLNQNQLQSLLENYSTPALVSFTGISDGIENTNYRVECEGQSFVLTIFEQAQTKDLDTLLALMHFLDQNDVQVPSPLSNSEGDLLSVLNIDDIQKPYILCPLLSGKHEETPKPIHCEQMGALLAKVHLLSSLFKTDQLSTPAHQWWQNQGQSIEKALGPEQLSLHQETVAFFNQNLDQTTLEALPKGIVHSDAFPDNVLFSDDKISAWLDWYDATNDYFIYDLAVIANSWCASDDGVLDSKKLSGLLSGYKILRPFSSLENTLWPTFLKLAAFRFWISRLIYVGEMTKSGRRGELNPKKNPEDFYKILSNL